MECAEAACAALCAAAACRAAELLLVQVLHDRWLRETVEVARDPDQRIVDAHHHLWDRHATRLWARRYMLEELAADVEWSGHNVTHTVYMQSASAGWLRSGGPEELRVVGETEVIQGVAAMAESGLYGACRCCAGIVATVDMALGEGVRPVLTEHMKVARNFRGVRYMGGKAEAIDFADPQFVAAAGVVAELGLVLDVNGPETHPLDFDKVLGGIAALARAVPNLTTVVDHCGGAVGPAAFEGVGGDERRRSWVARVAELSKLPNVYMKVGGLHMQANGFPLREGGPPVGSAHLAEMVLPYCEEVLRAFGPERCMAESNYPMDRLGVSYGILWNSLQRVAAALGLSQEHRDAFFWGTACRVYRL
eukprot:TRINITY_DN37402_c0_g1_i3.p1 TRINITY_DN37402_c0_g1~~TRINITY_DN37402_c0_g1_i3.p1  ORF type:complete len:364 (+),score=69.87 TRINITY_DN37402_c0_g1_i3:66-1157(+)